MKRADREKNYIVAFKEQFFVFWQFNFNWLVAQSGQMSSGAMNSKGFCGKRRNKESGRISMNTNRSRFDPSIPS